MNKGGVSERKSGEKEGNKIHEMNDYRQNKKTRV